MKFLPKRDLWLSIVMWACIAVLYGSGLTPIFIKGTGKIGGVILFLLCFSIASLLTWLWTKTYYVINESDLFIRSGPITESIPLENIRKVKPIRSWVANAATSNQRIEISFGRYDVVHVSPLEQEIFLKELKHRCPHITI
ncbi:PH domain-containing protein [Paenibacillus silvae]|nr:PH domain-containing protein [Paenibacillus silvae]